MSGPILHVTGTNTGVGKTTLAVLILRHWRAQKIRAAAMKPFCSGGREDAIRLHAQQTAGLTLDQANPFHFEAPITPLQAAREAGRQITLEQTLAAIDAIREDDVPLLIEGAGGLLSPLGENFSLLEIIQKRPGHVCIVGTNSLGVLNLVCLTARQFNLPPDRQSIVLMNPPTLDASSATNALLLNELLPGSKVHSLPFFPVAAENIPDTACVETLLAGF